jgi:hypothetical protein
LIPPSIATPKIFLDLRMTTSNGSSSETGNRHPVYMQIRNYETKNEKWEMYKTFRLLL